MKFVETTVRRKPTEQEIEELREAKITYEELFKAAETFGKTPEAGGDAWISARIFIDRENLLNLQTKEVRRRVIGFLNKWHCRLPVSDELAENIREAYRKSIPLLEALENETLENFEFEKRIDIKGEEYTNRQVLLEVFMNFCNIRYTRALSTCNLSGVCASKLLSLINPGLFVMWDTPICEAYAIKASSEPRARDKQYVPEFFPLMKQKANDAIDSYMKDKKCSRNEAIKAINSFRKWRPLAKLLDEYNWVTYSWE